MNSSPSLASTMFRQRAQPFPPSRSKGWTTRHALTVTMVIVLLTWVMYHEAFPSKESSLSQVQGDQPNPVPRKVMKDAGVSLDTKPKDIDTEEVTDLPLKSDTGKHSTEEDATKEVTPSVGSLTNNVTEPSTEEGETTADEKIEDEVPHKSNDTSVQHDHGTEFAEVQNEQARAEQESAEDVKATKASEEVEESGLKTPNDNRENGDHLDADDRLASLVDENEPEVEKKEESSKEKLEDESVRTSDSWSESIKESMEEGSHEDKLEEEEPTKTVREQDDQSGEVTAPAESSQGNTGLQKTEDENEKQTEIMVNNAETETSFSSEVQHEKEEELRIQDASSEVEQGGSSDEKMEEKPEDISHKPEQVEDGKDDMESENFDSENHKADSKEGQSAGETDLHESLSGEGTEARPDNAEELKGDEGEAWKDEEGERKAETQSDKQESVESQQESTQEAKPEDENIVKVQEAVTETGTSGNVDGHDSEEKVEGDVEERKSEEKVENPDPQQNLEASFTYNTAKKEDEDSKAEPA